MFQMADRRYSGQWKRSFFKVNDALVQLNMSMRIDGQLHANDPRIESSTEISEITRRYWFGYLINTTSFMT